MEREERCETCRWWDDEDGESGRCRRLSPRHVLIQVEPKKRNRIGSADDGVWPFTNPDDFCGEWTARKPLPVVS